MAIIATLPARCRFDEVRRAAGDVGASRRKWRVACLRVVADPDNPTRRLVGRPADQFVRRAPGDSFHLHEGRRRMEPGGVVSRPDRSARPGSCDSKLRGDASGRGKPAFVRDLPPGTAAARLHAVSNAERREAHGCGGDQVAWFWRGVGIGSWTLPGMERQGGDIQDEDTDESSREGTAETQDCGDENLAWTSVPAQRSSPVFVSKVPPRIPETRESGVRAMAALVEQEAVATAAESLAAALPVNGAAENSKISKSLEKCGEKKERSSHRLPNVKEIRAAGERASAPERAGAGVSSATDDIEQYGAAMNEILDSRGLACRGGFLHPL